MPFADTRMMDSQAKWLGHAATEEAPFGRAEHGKAGANPASPWYDRYDASPQTAKSIDKPVNAAHRDYVETLDCREAFRLRE